MLSACARLLRGSDLGAAREVDGPLARPFLDVDEGHRSALAWDHLHAAGIHPLRAQSRHHRLSRVVISDPGAEFRRRAQPRGRHHRGRYQTAALDRVLPQPRLAAGSGGRRQEEVVERSYA